MPVAVEGKTDIKDVFHVIRKSPALLITLLVGGVVVVYLLYKNGAGSSTPPSTTPSSGDSSGLATSQSPGSYYLPQDYTSVPSITLNPTTVLSATPPTVTATATSSATVPSVPTSPAPQAATVPSNDPFFHRGFEVIQLSKGGSNDWVVYNQSTKTRTELANIFPKGTTFSGGPSGQAYYTLPGSSTQQPLSAVGYYGHQYLK